MVAFFKDFTSAQVVQRIREIHAEQRGLLREVYIFVREDGSIRQLDAAGDEGPFEGRITEGVRIFYYYSQQFTVGVDIPQPAIMKGVTIVQRTCAETK